MTLQSLKEILHPSELKGRDKKRYWISAVSWGFFFIGLFALFSAISLTVIWLLILLYGEETLKPYEDFFLVWIILNGVASIVLGDRLWLYFFITRGYLSEAATIRILSNRAPTKKGERRHRWIGQAVLLMIYGIVAILAILEHQWWVLLIVVPLALWGGILIRNAWIESDKMLAGGNIPPESDERIQYIEKVLDERRRYRK